jgi:glycosyltransferase involved in cell wall biosynthesis
VSHPLISVVCPVRNAAATLERAIAGVLEQTCRDFELIAIDDGSTDGSGLLLDSFARQDARVRVLRYGGEGLTAALNRGVAAAAGRLIARQDADDISLPDRFRQQVAWLDAHPQVVALGTATDTIDDEGTVLGRFPMRTGAAAVRAGLRSGRATPVHGSMMIRRDALAAAGGYRSAFVTSQDFDLWLRLAELGDVDNLAATLYQWRLSRGSVYGARRRVQLQYAGLALAFANERERFGSDSYALLATAAGDVERFAVGYRLQGVLRAWWGSLLLRGLNDVSGAHRELSLAIRNGARGASTLLLWVWTGAGLPWIGGRPMRADGATIGVARRRV